MVEHPQNGPSSAQAPPQLAERADFPLGDAVVRPSLLTVEGPAGSAKGERRAIQVLVALADANGRVLSRDELLRLCWDNRIVGNDAINRSIAEVRRIAGEAGAGFKVETVPRVGYRILVDDADEEPRGDPGTRSAALSRRSIVVALASLAALAAVGGAVLVHRDRREAVDRLIERGRQLQAAGGEGDRRAEAVFRKAAEADPQRADAWGWLAVVLHDHRAAREAALRAIQIDPAEPNARAVLAYQRRDLDAWTRWEDALLEIVEDAPDNAIALSHLTLFYQGMGRCKASWETNERAIEVEPFHPGHHARRALKHWIFGRITEADRVSNQSLDLWPRHSSVWNARMLIYACTDRPEAALALLDDTGRRPGQLSEPSVRSWRAALAAIRSRSAADIRRAVEVCTATAVLSPGLAANAIMLFSYLDEVDAAYRVAEGLFHGRGPVVQQPGTGIKDIYSGSAWGRSQFLFIPATETFRADQRFTGFCERTGHVAYWSRRGIWPDPFMRGTLRVS